MLYKCCNLYWKYWESYLNEIRLLELVFVPVLFSILLYSIRTGLIENQKERDRGGVTTNERDKMGEG